MHRGRTRRKRKLGFVAFDSAKEKHAVAIADDGRDGEVRYLGEIDNSSDAVSKLVRRFTRLLSLHQAKRPEISYPTTSTFMPLRAKS
jgi:hypothetical protein